MKSRPAARRPAAAAAAAAAALADALMSGARARVKLPTTPLAEHRLTPAQLRDVGSKVKLAAVPGKGLGLVARRDLPAHTRVGVYGGKVYPAARHRQLTDAGDTTGKYAADFYQKGPDGKAKDGYIMDPGSGNGMHPSHANVLAAFINEPASGQSPNVVWVRNYAAATERLELWTSKPVRRGDELTACYGGKYPRTYATPCTSKPGFMHYVNAARRTPVPL